MFGGAGGYLLWRINQEQTVAPTDSDAGKCLDSVVIVDFAPYSAVSGQNSNEMGYVEEVREQASMESKIVRPVPHKEGYLRITLNNSCATGAKIKAVPKPGYKFSHWEEQTQGGAVMSVDGAGEKEVQKGLEAKLNTLNPIQVKREHSTFKTGYVVKKDVKLVAKFVPEGEGDCKEVSVVYEGLKTAEGSLTILKKAGNVVEKNNTIIQSFTKPDEVGSQIKAVPASGYKFKHWVNAVSGQIESTSVIIQKDAKELFGDKTCIERSFSLVLKPVYEKTGADIGPDKQARVIYQATPTECTKLLVCAPSDENRLTAANCLEQTASENEHVMPISIDPSKDKECVFQHWLVNGVRDGSELKRHDRAGKAGSVTTIIAVFKKEATPTEQTYSLRYSTEGNGKLRKDGGTPSSNTISVTVKEGASGPSVKAEPNTGYEFAYWIDNTTKKKDTSSLASTNPRQDTNVKGNISLTAHYEKSGGTTPPDDGDTKPPSTGDTDKDDLPGTAASPEGSLYIIVVGTLILSMGMLLPYLPAKINIKRKER